MLSRVLLAHSVDLMAESRHIVINEVTSLGRALIPRPSAYKALALGDALLYQAELPRLALTQITENKRLTVSSNLYL